MAVKHFLELDIPDLSCESILKITDISVYGAGLDIDCLRLDIWLPGFSTPTYFTDLLPFFTRNFSPIDFELQHPDTDALISLPDGLYTIRFSVSPNDKVYVEYYHLRTTRITNLYYKELCKVQLQNCEPDAEQHQKLHDLRYIKMYIDAAKSKAEYCHSPKQAVEMLAFSEKLLNKYKTGCCLTCK